MHARGASVAAAGDGHVHVSYGGLQIWIVPCYNLPAMSCTCAVFVQNSVV